MEMDIYKKLADHLDNLPGGFTPSDAGVDVSVAVYVYQPARPAT
jgi:hypothetical protein